MVSDQMKQMMIKFQSRVKDGDLEGLLALLSELESLHDTEEEYMVKLETEQMLLLDKINELGQEIINSSPSLSKRSSDEWSWLSFLLLMMCGKRITILKI